MSRFFRVDVRLCATLYVRADDEEAARAAVIDYAGTERGPEGDELFSRDKQVTDDIFMSPAVTFYGNAHGDGYIEELDESEVDYWRDKFD